MPFSTRVVLATPERELTAPGDCRDISMNGIFIRTEERLPLGCACQLAVCLSGSSSRLELHLGGVVSRHDADGLGIHFTDYDLDSYIHLKNLVRLNAADTDQVEAEMRKSLT
ncbi:MAG: hypothetical protein BWK76_25860 [Desulfobulbaceae bacterium A2]|nr:MAG: hypothetical protein BWK76_25860 [Desulfobulbaceae bacterium A2]